MKAPARQPGMGCQHHDIITTRCEKHTPCQHHASRPWSLLPTLALLSCQQLHHGAQSRWYSHLDLPLLPQVTILLSTPRPATQVTTNCRDSTALLALLPVSMVACARAVAASRTRHAQHSLCPRTSSSTLARCVLPWRTPTYPGKAQHFHRHSRTVCDRVSRPTFDSHFYRQHVA